jgi:tripartite-type tricarboxylate transporter receptor subunit TctC
MNECRTHVLHTAVAIALLAVACHAAGQQEFPTRPIRIVVPYPPGGSIDFLARLYGPRLADSLGRQIVIDNRGGGNTIIGNDIVAKATPDGHTLLLAGGAQVAIPHLYRNVPWDAIRDFHPVAGIARGEFLLVVNPSVPVRSVGDLIALAKKRPGELNYATSSTGGPTHLAAVQFEMLAAVKMQQVPYKGGGPAMTDLIAGQVQLGFANPASAMTFVRNEKLRAIAVTGETRLEALPAVPTFTEGGLPGLAMRNWNAIAVPAATPKAIIQKLEAVVMSASALPEVRAAITKQGLFPYSASAEEIDSMRRRDIVAVGKVIKAANIRMMD